MEGEWGAGSLGAGLMEPSARPARRGAGGTGEVSPRRRVLGGFPDVLEPSIVCDAAGRSLSRCNGTGRNRSLVPCPDAWAAPRRYLLTPRGSQPGTSGGAYFMFPCLVPLPPAPPCAAILLQCLLLRGCIRSGHSPPDHPSLVPAGEKASLAAGEPRPPLHELPAALAHS